jgi:tetratricopeptide (TPR) repeat protein
MLTISDGAPHVAVNFVLAPVSGKAESRVAAASAKSSEASSAPGLQLEAAGVRGLIDPGGYSAPANAAVASGLIHGLAEMKGEGKENDAGGEAWPCSLAPALETAAAASPGSAAAKQKLGNFYVSHGRSNEGATLLEEAHQIDDSEEITRDLAAARLALRDFDGARALLIGLASRQHDSALHLLLARADEGAGKFRQASEQYELASQQQPSEESLFGVGYELIVAGAPAEAASAFAEALQKYPDSIELLLGAGSAQFLQGKTSESVRQFLRATEVSPSDPRPYGFLASAIALPGAEASRICESFRRFTELAPDNADALYDYALGLWTTRQGRDTSANAEKIEGLLQRAIRLRPNFAKAHFQLGALYAEHGDYMEAVREYETTVRLSPELPEAHYRLANVYRHNGQTESAQREMLLFENMRKEHAEATSEGAVDLAQFVSVLAPRRREPAASSCEPQ